MHRLSHPRVVRSLSYNHTFDITAAAYVITQTNGYYMRYCMLYLKCWAYSSYTGTYRIAFILYWDLQDWIHPVLGPTWLHSSYAGTYRIAFILYWDLQEHPIHHPMLGPTGLQLWKTIVLCTQDQLIAARLSLLLQSIAAIVVLEYVAAAYFGNRSATAYCCSVSLHCIAAVYCCTGLLQCIAALQRIAVSRYTAAYRCIAIHCSLSLQRIAVNVSLQCICCSVSLQCICCSVSLQCNCCSVSLQCICCSVSLQCICCSVPLQCIAAVHYQRYTRNFHNSQRV